MRDAVMDKARLIHSSRVRISGCWMIVFLEKSLHSCFRGQGSESIHNSALRLHFALSTFRKRACSFLIAICELVILCPSF